MNYEQTELLEQLAGAYVVGTLRGLARARFERLSERSGRVRTALQRWEDRFMPLLAALTPVTPRDQVWEQIARRITSQAPAATDRAPRWRWALAGALALSLIVGVSVWLFNPPLQTVAALGQDRLHPLWNVARTANSTTLQIRALQAVQSNPQLAYELWALPSNGQPPVSLGLMPRAGSIERALSAAQRVALLSSNRIAITLEPAGGSPTGKPTGPIVYAADVSQSG